MNNEWIGKTIWKKNPIQNIEKNSKNQCEIAACEKKAQARKRIFVETPFSPSTLKLEGTKFTPQNHSLFQSTPCFGVTKITNPI